MNVLVYSRHRLTPWWRQLAAQLGFASHVTVASEFRGDADIYVMASFYSHLASDSATAAAVGELGADACDEIVRRCRFLRLHARDRALELVGAMWLTLNELVDQVAPHVVLSLNVDYYGMDLLERILRRRGIPLVSLMASPFAGATLVCSRGEHNHVRDPDEADVDRALAAVRDPAFAPWLPHGHDYGLRRFLSRYAYYTARSVAFAAIARWNRDPLNFHYWLTRPGLGFRVRFRDQQAMRYVDHDWRRALDAVPVARRFFMALSVNPESTLDYWANDTALLDYGDVTERVATAFTGAGYRVFVKDHPNMFGFRDFDLLRRLSGLDGVTVVPYDVPVPTLVNATRCTLGFGGTVGIQAAVATRPAIVTDTYYYLPDHFVRLGHVDEIASLPERSERFEPRGERESRELIRHVLQTTVRGDLYKSFGGLRRTGSDADIQLLAADLNEYVPALVTA